MKQSITGGSSALSVVFGWNVVIKSVPLLLLRFLLISFVACSTCQVKYIHVTTHCVIANYFLGTIIGAFVVDYLGAKYTMVCSQFYSPSFTLLIGAQITGLLLQAIIGFIMSGLYAQCVNCRISLDPVLTKVKYLGLPNLLVLLQYGELLTIMIVRC